MKKEVWSFEKKTPKVRRSWGLMKISGQNILEINEGKSPLEMCRGRGQMQQRVQDNGRGPGLVGYVMWKSDTKSAAWVSLDAVIHSDSSPVSLYPNQITLYRSLHAHQWLILESTIREISYSGSPSIMTGAVLRSMPSGDSMDMGQGYDDIIGCATCSLSQRLMQKVLLPYFVLAVSSCFRPHVCLVVDLWTSTNSVDTFMYPYALPLPIHPLYFLKSLPKCNLSSSLRSLHLVKRRWAHLAREVQ